jgi:hypothetical protein
VSIVSLNRLNRIHLLGDHINLLLLFVSYNQVTIYSLLLDSLLSSLYSLLNYLPSTLLYLLPANIRSVLWAPPTSTPSSLSPILPLHFTDTELRIFSHVVLNFVSPPVMASLNLSSNGPSISKSYQTVVNAPPPSTAGSPTYGQWAVFSVSTPLVSAFQQDAGKESVLKVQSSGGQ